MPIKTAQKTNTYKHTYLTSPASYTEDRGDGLYEVTIGNKKYQVETDEQGKPVKLHRFNEKYKMYVSLSFIGSEEAGYLDSEIMEILKKSCLEARLSVDR